MKDGECDFMILRLLTNILNNPAHNKKSKNNHTIDMFTINDYFILHNSELLLEILTNENTAVNKAKISIYSDEPIDVSIIDEVHFKKNSIHSIQPLKLHKYSLKSHTKYSVILNTTTHSTNVSVGCSFCRILHHSHIQNDNLSGGENK